MDTITVLTTSFCANTFPNATTGHLPMQPPPYEPPPPWIPLAERLDHRGYNNDLQTFLPRKVFLRRMKLTDALGFHIRGGSEHNYGFYVSKVMPQSEAACLGIKEGDQILQVNGINFDSLDHAEAVKVLKMYTSIEMIVRFFPYGYHRTYDYNPSDYSHHMMPTPSPHR